METGFGWIKINGQTYEHDIIIHVNKTITPRKKELSENLKPKYGHTPLSEKELDFLEKEHPEVVYIGTGQYGLLPITEEAKRILEKYNTIIKPTPEILDLIKKEKRKFVAIIHVTC
jgi:hypothetical protein